MNLKVVEKDWNSLESAARSITEHNRFMTEFQSFDYLNQTGKGFTARHPFHVVGMKSRNFLLLRDDTPVAIAPLLVKGEDVILRGELTGAGQLDFLYQEDFSYEEFSCLMDEIIKTLGKKNWLVGRISEKALTKQYFDEYTKSFPNLSTEKSTCVEIKIPASYDEWYQPLSKSVRQNLRTSYNRMNTDGIAWEFSVEWSGKVPADTFRQIMDVASRRAIEYGNTGAKWMRGIVHLLKNNDPVIKYIRNCPHLLYATVKLNGKMAASLFGFYCEDGRLIIPRLSYNSEFYRYSPGGVLINEIIKQLTESKAPYRVESLDLSRGEERYKYDFGGLEHFNTDYKF